MQSRLILILGLTQFLAPIVAKQSSDECFAVVPSAARNNSRHESEQFVDQLVQMEQTDEKSIVVSLALRPEIGSTNLNATFAGLRLRETGSQFWPLFVTMGTEIRFISDAQHRLDFYVVNETAFSSCSISGGSPIYLRSGIANVNKANVMFKLSERNSPRNYTHLYLIGDDHGGSISDACLSGKRLNVTYAASQCSANMIRSTAADDDDQPQQIPATTYSTGCNGPTSVCALSLTTTSFHCFCCANISDALCRRRNHLPPAPINVAIVRSHVDDAGEDAKRKRQAMLRSSTNMNATEEGKSTQEFLRRRNSSAVWPINLINVFRRLPASNASDGSSQPQITHAGDMQRESMFRNNSAQSGRVDEASRGVCLAECENGHCFAGFLSNASIRCHCECNPGFTGICCDADINECEAEPCQNEGVCENLENSFRCSCQAGWFGSVCEKRQPSCTPNPCGMDSRCFEDNGEIECVADFAKGYLPKCDSLKCSNGGECYVVKSIDRCYCPLHFGGTFCEDHLAATEFMLEMHGSSNRHVFIVLGAIALSFVVIATLVFVCQCHNYSCHFVWTTRRKYKRHRANSDDADKCCEDERVTADVHTALSSQKVRYAMEELSCISTVASIPSISSSYWSSSHTSSARCGSAQNEEVILSSANRASCSSPLFHMTPSSSDYSNNDRCRLITRAV